MGLPEGFDEFACQIVDGLLVRAVPTSTIEDQDADVVMTTMGVRHGGETVPASYRPPDAVMVDVGRAISTQVTRRSLSEVAPERHLDAQ